MSFKEKIKSNPRLKAFALWMLIPRNQARPRLWVKWFVNPFIHTKGKASLIRGRTRMDTMPFNPFELGDNSTVEDFCTVNNGMGGVYIGNNTRIGIGSVLIGPVRIGAHVRLAQNIVVTALNHNYQDINMHIDQQGVNTQEIVVGDGTWIGANSVVLPGVKIGEHCIIAAGSILTKDVPSYAVVAGNPARIIKQYNEKTNSWERPGDSSKAGTRPDPKK